MWHRLPAGENGRHPPSKGGSTNWIAGKMPVPHFLNRLLTDGRIPIDNNDVEQLMKQVALGRKNCLFIGSVAAGGRAADFLTLVSSALRNDLDV